MCRIIFVCDFVDMSTVLCRSYKRVLDPLKLELCVGDPSVDFLQEQYVL